MAMVNINPMRIPGNWKQGFVLDYHTLRSNFLGHDEFGHPIFDTKRSEIGELLYKLKYRSDKSVAEDIIKTVVSFVVTRNLDLSAIIPVPPSRKRLYQPVLELSKGISVALDIPWHTSWVVKTKETDELKNVYDYNERLTVLENAYTANDPASEGANVLLFDDLYRSGATLNAVTTVLYTHGKVANVYALALTRTRSAA